MLFRMMMQEIVDAYYKWLKLVNYPQLTAHNDLVIKQINMVLQLFPFLASMHMFQCTEMTLCYVKMKENGK